MKREDVRYDQRVRVNVPGVGDHGQVGTVKRIRGGVCSVHLDRDQRPRHLFVFFAGDLDPVADERLVVMEDGAAPLVNRGQHAHPRVANDAQVRAAFDADTEHGAKE